MVFIAIEDLVTKITLFAHPDPLAVISLITNVKETAVGAVIKHYVDGSHKQLPFIFKRLPQEESRHNMFAGKLPAVQLAVRHSRHAF